MFDGLERIEFEHEGTRLRWYAAVPDATEPSPAVLVMHSALGVAHRVNEQVARKLSPNEDTWPSARTCTALISKGPLSEMLGAQ